MTRPRAFAALVVGLLLCVAGPIAAQPGPELAITVLDQTGARIVGATVRVTGIATDPGQPLEVVTDADGVARLAVPARGRYRVAVESAGFETVTVDLNVGQRTRRTVRLPLAKVYETVDVGRDPRERASDPREDLFSTILGDAQIQELPDDPDEMERVLREMAGPGAVMRVNGFRGGRLPPKDQIARIRFRRNMFAADAHEPGFLAVDIVTRPGLDGWRGSTGVGLRDTVLNARNALAPVRGEERLSRGALTLSGPLARGRTSLALAADASDAYDAQTIVAALAEGLVSRNVRRPTTAVNLSARIEHAFSRALQGRLEWQRNHTAAENLGVGNFDLETRAYSQDRHEQVVRGSLAGAVGRFAYNELRLSFRSRGVDQQSLTAAPAIVVLNAFTSGGAQVDGGRSSSEWELADDLDYARGRHAARAGLLLQAGRYRSDEWRNALGTFTFPSLEAFRASRPAVFTRTVGDPRVAMTQVQTALYLQDDVRASQALTLSAGLRVEHQSQIGGLNLAPRGGFAWAPFRSGRTTLRGGGGRFYDWFDADSYLRALQTDGTRQRVETVAQPAYPGPPPERGVQLANGRTAIASDVGQPRLTEFSAAVDQQLGAVRLSTTYIHRRGSRLLRGIDLNAPAAGGRPDPFAGPITEIRSIARSAFDALSVNVNVAKPERRLFLAANYMLSRTTNEADTPFDLPADAGVLAAERGPAADDARHRAMAFGSAGLGRGLSAGVSVTARSALPYDVTTGRDDNGDTVLRDRPAGITRNSARGRAQVDVGARVAWRLGFGGERPQAPSGPQVRIVRGGDGNPLAGMPGGDGPERYAVEVYAQAFNLLNRTNPQAFGGVIASPFYRQVVAAAAPRRIEVGARFTF